VVQRDDSLLPHIRALKAEHPFGGYRRIGADLRVVEQRPVHKQRILRLMREPHLLAPPNWRLQAKRTPIGSNPKPLKPNAWWGIEMTKGLGQGGGGVSIVVVLEW
jgi:putative transposase